MNRNQILCLLVTLLCCAPTVEAQMPVPHELLGHKRSSFKVPRARAWDEENYKYFGGGPDLDNECGGAGHCFHRPAVWSCPHYIAPPYPATWILRGEGLGFSRLSDEEPDILFRTTDDADLFSMEDFDFETSVAYRVSAQRNFGEHLGLELVYLRVHDAFEADAEINDAAPIELRAAGIVINSPADPFDLLYTTQMQSGEANFRYAYNNYASSAFIGFRWLEIDELFRGGVDGAPPPLRVETKNKLLGGQIGFESQHWVSYGILRIDSSIRGGIYQNSAHQISRFDPDLATMSGQDLAWVGESELAANFPITKNTYLRVTYRLIHVAGLAVAADQLNGTDLTVPAAVLNTNGDAIYHGWSVGLEAWW